MAELINGRPEEPDCGCKHPEVLHSVKACDVSGCLCQRYDPKSKDPNRYVGMDHVLWKHQPARTNLDTRFGKMQATRGNIRTSNRPRMIR